MGKIYKKIEEFWKSKTSIRVYPWYKEAVSKHYGGVQKLLDAAIERELEENAKFAMTCARLQKKMEDEARKKKIQENKRRKELKQEKKKA